MICLLRVKFCRVIVFPLNPFESFMLRYGCDIYIPTNNICARQKGEIAFCDIYEEIGEVNGILYRHG